MFLDALILVLRETLEAGVLISLVYSVMRGYQLSGHYLWWALIAGAGGAIAYAEALAAISQWWDYRGQELVNASLQIGIYVAIAALLFLMFQPPRQRERAILACALLAIALAVIREGSEIFLFVQGFSRAQAVGAKLLACGFVGLTIGISVGALTYYGVVALPLRWRKAVQLILLLLVGAGMVGQAAQLLLQVDILPAGLPLWNSNRLLPEASMGGQLLYAVFGYEATPTAAEIALYLLALILIPASLFLKLACRTRFKRTGPHAASP